MKPSNSPHESDAPLLGLKQELLAWRELYQLERKLLVHKATKREDVLDIFQRVIEGEDAMELGVKNFEALRENQKQVVIGALAKLLTEEEQKSLNGILVVLATFDKETQRLRELLTTGALQAKWNKEASMRAAASDTSAGARLRAQKIFLRANASSKDELYEFALEEVAKRRAELYGSNARTQEITHIETARRVEKVPVVEVTKATTINTRKNILDVIALMGLLTGTAMLVEKCHLDAEAQAMSNPVQSTSGILPE